MLATSVSACATERPAQDCEFVWRGQRWHQAEDPIWVSPSVPDQGVVPTLKMSTLHRCKWQSLQCLPRSKRAIASSIAYWMERPAHPSQTLVRR